jgi:predicted ABC-type ATPase
VSEQPELLIIAGPNGAGKTTFVNTYLPGYTNIREFVNADLIAMGISPFNPADAQMEAGRVLLSRTSQLMEERKSFARETTLSGQGYKSLIADATSLGYAVKLFYIYLNSTELCQKRIADRVKKGGHNVPADVVIRRYDRSLHNFFGDSMQLVDSWELHDNSGEEYRLVALGNNRDTNIADSRLYDEILKRHEL